MSYTVKAVASIQEIGQQVWDSCAHPTGTQVDPFVGFAFLNALEQSGSVAAETGWAPYHLVLESEAQETVA
ncbi:MAG: peptidogalycan biosysnthesis protein, partial [Pseudomonadota bacterium]|nr:peptidogalycan biosysnthesis protein [Pseudomonadota bacterium]